MPDRRTGFHDIHAAGFDGDTDQIRKLIKGGAYVNAIDARGRTALHFVARYHAMDHPSAVLLLEAGADPAIKDKWGRTAKDVRAYYKNLQDKEAEQAEQQQQRSQGWWFGRLLPWGGKRNARGKTDNCYYMLH